jgi:sporulation protein YlmC with PRC-barrel domain
MHPSQNWHDSFWLKEYRPLKLLGSALLGRAVFGRQGRKVADVDDLVIASKGDRARVVNIILGDGGFSGLSDARVTVPYRPVSINYYGIQYPIGEAELEKMPAFDPR